MTTAWSWLIVDGTDGKERLFSDVLKMLALISTGWLIIICQTSCLYTIHLIKQGRLGNWCCRSNQCAKCAKQNGDRSNNSKLKLASLLLQVHLSAAILFIWSGTTWSIRSESDPAEPLLNPNNWVGRSRPSLLHLVIAVSGSTLVSTSASTVEKVAESAELPRPS